MKKQAFALNLNKLLFLFLILLIPLTSAHFSSYGSGNIQVVFDKEPIVSGEISKMHIMLIDEQTGAAIRELDTVHERKLHVFIVGGNLDEFAHIHSEDFENGFSNIDQGYYNLEYIFKKAGNYAIYLDYTLNGKNYLAYVPIEVYGSEYIGTSSYDPARKIKSNNYEISLEAPDKIFISQETELVYHLSKDNKDVKNLQMLLGSEVHAFVIKDNLMTADHTHSYIPGHYVHSGNMSQHYSGPSIPIHLTFKEPGTYAIFSQFKHEDKIINARFMVKVDSLNANKANAKVYSFFIIAFIVIVVVFIMRYNRRLNNTDTDRKV